MKKYDNIQIFRVLACLGVFITHVAPRMGVTGWAAKAANAGASGVYLFFIISGFLACSAKEIGTEAGKKGILIYYCKRFFRILPLYYGVILYNMLLHSLVLKDVTPDPGGLYWLRYFFLTNAFLPAPDNFWANLSATWTISLFAVFYLCAPFLVRMARGIKSGLLLYAATLFLRYVWVEAGLSAYMMIFYYLHYFVLGILVWQLAKDCRRFYSIAVLAALAGGILLLIRLAGNGTDSFMVQSWFFAAAILLTGGFSWEKGKQTAMGLAVKRGFAVLDRYSYAVYLVHAAVVDGIVLLQARVQISGLPVLLLATLLTAAGAWAAHEWVEKPAEKFGRSLVTALRM